MPRRVLRLAGSSRWAVLILLFAASLARATVGDSTGVDQPSDPPGAVPKKPSATPKVLSDTDAKRIEGLNERISSLQQSGKFAEAVEPARQVVDLCEKALGPDHWQTGDARRALEVNQRLSAQPREVQDRYAKSLQGEAPATQLFQHGKFAEAARCCQEILAIRQEVLGESHPDTANSYELLGVALRAQGKYSEAEERDRRALAIRLKTLGEGHPDTATSYGNLAATLGTSQIQ